MEVVFETKETKGKMWVVFVYASTREKTRKDQWGNCGQRKRNEAISGFLWVISIILGNLRKTKGEEKDL